MFGVHTGRHKQFCDMLAEHIGSEVGSFLEMALMLLFQGGKHVCSCKSRNLMKLGGLMVQRSDAGTNMLQLCAGFGIDSETWCSF